MKKIILSTLIAVVLLLEGCQNGSVNDSCDSQISDNNNQSVMQEESIEDIPSLSKDANEQSSQQSSPIEDKYEEVKLNQQHIKIIGVSKGNIVYPEMEIDIAVPDNWIFKDSSYYIDQQDRILLDLAIWNKGERYWDDFECTEFQQILSLGQNTVGLDIIDIDAVYVSYGDSDMKYLYEYRIKNDNYDLCISLYSDEKTDEQEEFFNKIIASIKY